MTYTQLFIRFLKENNAYHLFLYNICNRKENSKLYNLYDFKSINNVLALNFLANPFIWHNTKQGYDFWYNINAKWRDILRNTLGNNTMTLYNLKGNDIIEY